MKTASVLKTRNTTILALLIAATVVVALFVILSRQRTGSNHSEGGNEAGGKDPNQTRTDLLQKVLALEAKEAEWNRTIWASELEAQRHEEVFTQLWDTLRRSPDASIVLRDFAFLELHFGTPTSAEKHDHQIERFYLRPPLRSFSRSQWDSMLLEWKRAGYGLEQSEWRHLRFEPGSPARSVFKFNLHVANAEREERKIFRGRLRITWLENQNQNELPKVGNIEASEVEVLSRLGRPPFVPAISTVVNPDPGSVFIDPLIVYDLDHDGLPEIILGCKNLVYWNKGQGRLVADSLCKIPPARPDTALVADFNRDGLEDVIFANLSGFQLYLGDESGKFLHAPVLTPLPQGTLFNPFVMTAGDVDQDGDADLFLAQYKVPYVAGQMPTPYYDANDGFASFLLKNDGAGKFSDVTPGSGLEQKRFRRTYSASLVDLDKDRDLDLEAVRRVLIEAKSSIAVGITKAQLAEMTKSVSSTFEIHQPNLPKESSAEKILTLLDLTAKFREANHSYFGPTDAELIFKAQELGIECLELDVNVSKLVISDKNYKVTYKEIFNNYSWSPTRYRSSCRLQFTRKLTGRSAF